MLNGFGISHRIPFSVRALYICLLLLLLNNVLLKSHILFALFVVTVHSEEPKHYCHLSNEELLNI